MLAFHNDQAIKQKYIARVQAHQEADEIIKGKYWEKGKGCAVGCTIHSSAHASYETELGIPHVIAHLEDGIFEGLSNEEAKKFPLHFLQAVKVGSDLSGIADKFMHWLLVDSNNGVICHAHNDTSKAAIQQVGDLYARKISGDKVSQSDWKEAAAAAAAACAYAAVSAACVYAAYADAREQSCLRQANKLIELIEQAPMWRHAGEGK